MCTALLSIEPGLPTVLVGVRDELINRPWQPPGRHWPRYPGLAGGLDLQAGGTWFAVAPADSRAACVLNARGRPAKEATRRSRGSLPLAAAVGDPLDHAALVGFDPFHLLTVEPGRALSQIWDGDTLTEIYLTEGLHFAVNSGWASNLSEPAPSIDKTNRPAHSSALIQPNESAPDRHAHELARIDYFLPRFAAATRPSPLPSRSVAEAWGDWFPLINGNGIAPGDDRALLPRRDLGGGRIWGTTSISLAALAPDGLRYDFTGTPGDPGAWSTGL